MSPRSLNKRINDLMESITLTAYSFLKKGLFEKHKLIVTTMLTLRIMIK